MWNFLPEHQAGLRGYINSGERLLDLRQVAFEHHLHNPYCQNKRSGSAFRTAVAKPSR